MSFGRCVLVRALGFGLVLLAVVAWAPSASGATPPAPSGSVANAISLSGTDAVTTAGTYAYTTAYNAGTLTVVDISNPASPQVVGQTPSASSLFNGTNIAVSGSYAYVVSKNRNGPFGSKINDDGTGNSLTIVDISNPTAPSIVGSLHDSVNLFGAYGVAVSGMYAYVAAQGCLSGQPCPNTSVGDDFAVIDVFDPSSPTLVATIHNQSLPAPYTGSGALKHATSVALMGDYAYVTASYSNRLTAIDISNPAQPAIVGSLLDNTALDFPVDVATGNGYAYVADQASGVGRVAAVDVGDPAAMRIASYVTNRTWLNGAYRIRVRNPFAYVAGTYASTMAAVDISDPTRLRFAGGFSSTALLNRTTGLDLDPTGTYAISVSPRLSTESSATYPPYALQPGGPTDTGTVTAIALDPSPVGVTITPSSEPPSTTGQTGASFAFTLADAVSTPRCSIDASDFTLCTTPATQSYTGLAPGQHTFTVEAIDAAGNVATATYSWTITAPQAPVATGLPDITGQPVERQLLFATPGTWTGSPAPTLAYQWRDCDQTGTACTPIAGATGNSYTLTSTDVGSTVDVVVTATNTAGSASATSSPTATIAAASTLAPTTPVLDGFNRANGAAGPSWGLIRPTGFAAMKITGDTAADASTTQFAWNYWKPSTFGPDSEAYATITTWGPSDVIRIGARVTFSGTTYSGYFVAISAAGAWSIIRIDNAAVTTLATGPTQPLAAGDQIAIRITGATITALHYTPTTNWTQVLTYDTGTDTTRYTNPGSLALEFKTSTIDNFGGGTLASASAPPANQTPPAITGTATVGQTLTLNPGSWTGTPTPTLTYQWQDCDTTATTCTPIPGATTTTYLVAATDTGSTIDAVVTATNTTATTTATTTPTPAVTTATAPPANQTPPAITGTATVGQTLTLNPGSWTGTPTPTLTYQWQDCDTTATTCTPIPGATTTTYLVAATDTGSTIDAVVTATNTTATTTATTTPTPAVTTASSLAPTTPVLDDFNRPNGTAGPNWSLIRSSGFAAMKITGDTAADASTTQFAWNYWNPATFGPDSEAYATITTWGPSDVIRIGARVTFSGTTYSGYFVAISAAGAWSIIRIDNAAVTTLATGPTQPLAAGDQIAIRITGATITALHYTPTTNWTQVLTYDTSTDTTRYTNPGSLALEFKTSTIDNFGGGTI